MDDEKLFEEIDDDLFLHAFDENVEETGNDVPGMSDSSVNVPTAFQFPYQPYDIQLQLMKKLYEAIELGKIGIFESPTGTGKSLSLICGALTWLRDFEQRQKQELESLLNAERIESSVGTKLKTTDEEPDWIADFAKKRELDEIAKKLKEEQELHKVRETKLQNIRSNLQPSAAVKRKRDTLDEQFDELFAGMSEKLQADIDLQLANEGHEGELSGDDDIIVAEYVSDDEVSMSRVTAGESDLDDKFNDDTFKIYYCSRTHSQLSQFVREIKKSPFGEDTRVVSLGSRQNLCINEAVRGLKSLSLMNDRCLELQKNKQSSLAAKQKQKSGVDSTVKRSRSAAGGCCPYYKSELLSEFRDQTLVQVSDIEQLVSMGKQMKVCPYYGTRYAVPSAQLVVLPYNTLLHKSTRESCGIRLKGNVVIIDEGHNLMETISNIHSVVVTGSQLSCAHSQLSQYMDRYRQRLKARNVMYIKQILFILSNFIKVLGGKSGAQPQQVLHGKSENKLTTINDFLFDTHLDNLNLFKVLKYCRRCMISKKLLGFVEKYKGEVHIAEHRKEIADSDTWALSNFLREVNQAKEATLNNNSPAENVKPVVPNSGCEQTIFASPLMHIESLLEALTTADKDGRMVIEKQDTLGKSSLKFLLLNPAVHFADVVSEARAVIIAGGTMQPMSEFKEQLFYSTGTKPERILEFSCGHIIPPSNLLPIALARGSSGLQFDFTYQSRQSKEMMNELGRVVYNTANIVPGGMVCFFPSYEYEKIVYAHWEEAGYLEKMSQKKKVFREPKQANQVDRVLQEYSTVIKRHAQNKNSQYNGAILCCVVGGKMSEGINFSDELGRCVVVVGLPYPNAHSAELKEKMDYLNAHMPRADDGRSAGQVHFENLCMKAVNQSIGRAIRHKDDYAAILLLDHRYLRSSVKSKLPGWIGDNLRVMDRFGPAFAAIRQFFTMHNVDKIAKTEPDAGSV